MKCKAFRPATVTCSRLCVDCGELPNEHTAPPPAEPVRVLTDAREALRGVCALENAGQFKQWEGEPWLKRVREAFEALAATSTGGTV